MVFSYPDNSTRGPRNARISAAYEIAITCVDFAAALLFVVGSICFACKPSIRLAREIHVWRLGKVDEVAERARG